MLRQFNAVGGRPPDPADDCKVFLGNLPFQCTEEDILDLFPPLDGDEGGDDDAAAAAPRLRPTAVRIPVDRGTGRSRGFAFVSFESRQAAEMAVDMIDGAHLDGRAVRADLTQTANSGGRLLLSHWNLEGPASHTPLLLFLGLHESAREFSQCCGVSIDGSDEPAGQTEPGGDGAVVGVDFPPAWANVEEALASIERILRATTSTAFRNPHLFIEQVWQAISVFPGPEKRVLCVRLLGFFAATRGEFFSDRHAEHLLEGLIELHPLAVVAALLRLCTDHVPQKGFWSGTIWEEALSARLRDAGNLDPKDSRALLAAYFILTHMSGEPTPGDGIKMLLEIGGDGASAAAQNYAELKGQEELLRTLLPSTKSSTKR